MPLKFISLILIFLPFHAMLPQDSSHVTFTEVMFRPAGSNAEFVEVFNLSDTDSIDLAGYSIIYQTSSADSFIPADTQTKLAPNSFAVIFEGDYDFDAGVYTDLISGDALILTLDDNAFGSAGMANTSDRTLYLINAAGDTVDVYTYTTDNSEGISDEKIILNDDNTVDNWSNSLTINGSPGTENTVSPKNYDVGILDVKLASEFVFEGNDVEILISIKNYGLLEASNLELNIFDDVNNDTTGTEDELIAETFIEQLPADVVLMPSFVINDVTLKTYNLVIEVRFEEDQFTDNNHSYFNFDVLPRPVEYNSIVINEIMYKPEDDEPEWVELFNNSTENINLNGWSFSDASSSVTLSEEDLTLPAGSFIILSDTESLETFYEFDAQEIVLNLPSLNNGGDNLKIIDSYNRVIDSVNYKSTWGGITDGKSLERLLATANSNDSTNWSSSTSPRNGTPGKENSVTPKDYDIAVTRFEMLDEFAVTGEQVSFEITVKNFGLEPANNFSINVENHHNGIIEFVTSLQINTLASSDSSVITFSTGSFIEGKNIFIAIINYPLDQKNENDSLSLSITGLNITENEFDIVINEIMYAPNSPEPEWIELYNRSDKTINLLNYKIADKSDTSIIFTENLALGPDEYFVIADDSSFYEIYNLSENLIIADFPSLNNSGDDVKLLNYINTIIDSVSFQNSWGGTKGLSLERIDTEQPAADSINWGSAQPDVGGTPGKVNSISRKSFDVAVGEILFEPAFPFIGDDVQISVVATNAGKENVSFTLKLYLDEDLDSVTTNVVEESGLISLAAAGSFQHTFNFTINKISSAVGIICEAVLAGDENLLNNKTYAAVFPGYPARSLLINEIMFTPQNGEPEWIELYNNSNSTIDISGCSISDVLTSPITRVITEESIKILPDNFLVVAKDSSVFEFHNNIPSQVAVSNFANLNNDTDGVVIKDANGNVIDSVLYSSDWGKTGYSIERISFSAGSNDSSNWAASTDIEQSTPGRQNSVTPKQYDLKLERITTLPEFPIEGDDVYIQALIRNVGLNTATEFTIEFYTGYENNFTLLDQVQTNNLLPGDSTEVNSEIPFTLNEPIVLRVQIIYSLDEELPNNSLAKEIVPGYPEGSIIITEFMFDPLDGSGEWIEFYNNSNSAINLKGWLISDLLSSPTAAVITTDDVIIEPGEFVVAANDSVNLPIPNEVKLFNVKFGTLGNSEDGIVIYDFRNAVIDSLRYDKDWNVFKGRSLERIDFDYPASEAGNWVPSINPWGGTPGANNSVANIPGYTFNDAVINEIMFEPDTDNSEFIEILNIRSEPVNIGGWTFSDESGKEYYLSNVSFELLPNDFFVIASDSSILTNYSELANSSNLMITGTNDLSLSNSGEAVFIKDLWGNVIDSVSYSGKWHNHNIVFTQNKSLERINPFIDSNDPGNWSTSVNNSGATPGQQNSIFTARGTAKSKLEITPNPFSPDNDGFEDFTIVSYNLKESTAQIRIKIFDDHGRLVRTLANNKPSGSTGSIIFDGLSDDGRPLRIGMYIVFLEALNSNSGVVETMKKVVVVARKL